MSLIFVICTLVLLALVFKKYCVYIRKQDGNIVLSKRYVCFKENFKKQANYKRKSFQKYTKVEFCILCQSLKRGIPMNLQHQEVGINYHHNISNVHGIQAEMANDSGIRQKLLSECLSQQVGGRDNVSFTFREFTNHLKYFRRMKEMKSGEDSTLIHCFNTKQVENPCLFSEIPLDVDDQITGIYWADAKENAAYVSIGDVICFNTTCRTN